MVIFTASPGVAPSMNTGPVTGLIRPKSRVATSATVLVLVSWPPEESRHSKAIVVPGATLSAGGTALSQPM